MRAIRTTCEFPDCHRPGRNAGNKKGKTYYDRFCTFHHRSKGLFDTVNFKRREKISNKKCEKCGWDKTYCDRHRIDKYKGYSRENVLVLCPNCHREETVKQSKK